MIVRVFRGEVRPGCHAEFERLLRERGIPGFRAQPGMLRVHVATPTVQAPDEFLVVTLWRDLESLRGYTGERWSQARVTPDEAPLLRRTFVHHYETPVDPGDLLAPGSEVIEAGPLRVDLLRRIAIVEGREVELPPKEFAVLAELVRRPDRPVPAAELARLAWPEGDGTTGDDVRRAIYRLRRLLGDHHRTPALIRNRRGHGYVLSTGGSARHAARSPRDPGQPS
ncbi:MAG: winged helix-turn-helix domain-containing protein [Actinomycetota bacterium]